MGIWTDGQIDRLTDTRAFYNRFYMLLCSLYYCVYYMLLATSLFSFPNKYIVRRFIVTIKMVTW